MQDRTFDRITKRLAVPPTRRGFLRGLGALATGGIAMTAFGKRRAFERAIAGTLEDPDERGVLFIEEIARIAREQTGSCDDLHRTFQEFQEQYKDELAEIRAVESTWTKDHIRQNVIKYGARRQAAADAITPVMERCNPDDGASNSGMVQASSRDTTNLASLLGMGMGATRGLAQSGAGCSPDNYNFLVEGYCHKPGTDWSSPSFQWPAYCANGDIDDDCDLCAENTAGTNTNPGICTHYWPDDCLDGEGNNLCVVDYHHTHGGISTSVCDDRPAANVLTATARCYSHDSDWHSPDFTWQIFCPKGYGDSDCIDCGEYNGDTAPEICEKYWPQDCVREGYGNICYVGFHYSQVDADCHDECPMSHGDCAASWLEGLTGDAYNCGACQSAWCGSEEHCMDRCVATGGCDDECGSGGSSGGSWNSDDDDDFPGGEGRTGGTPVPIHGTGTPAGTHTATPTGTPSATPTGTPGGTPTETPAVTPTAAPTNTPTATPTEISTPFPLPTLPLDPPSPPDASPVG